MSTPPFVEACINRWFTSDSRLSLQRTTTELCRRLTRRGHELHYFHRADDPYCQLMVQVLPDLANRFNVSIRPHVIERLPANMYPDPERYEAYSIIDASRLARLYGLGFPYTATVPDRLAVGMANRYLASMQEDPDFFALAEEIGAAVWQHDLKTVRSRCVIADVAEKRLLENEQFLQKLGHCQSALVCYGEEFYPGLDRLDLLERRLNKLRVGDDEVHFELTRLWRYQLERMERSIAGKTLELFFCLASPHSYLALSLAAELAEKTGVRLKLRPVLPMKMRGQKTPLMKWRYMMLDAAREARLEGLPFGKVVFPAAEGVSKAMALGFALSNAGHDVAFYKAYMSAVWAQGLDVDSEKGLEAILRAAGLETSWLAKTLPEEEWRRLAHSNLQDMQISGGWAVPTFRVNGAVLWGQDRLWAVVDALKQP